MRYRVDAADTVSVAVPAVEKSKDAEGKIQYEDVRLVDCLEALLSPETLEYACPSCGKSVYANK